MEESKECCMSCSNNKRMYCPIHGYDLQGQIHMGEYFERDVNPNNYKCDSYEKNKERNQD